MPAFSVLVASSRPVAQEIEEENVDPPPPGVRSSGHLFISPTALFPTSSPPLARVHSFFPSHYVSKAAPRSLGETPSRVLLLHVSLLDAHSLPP